MLILDNPIRSKAIRWLLVAASVVSAGCNNAKQGAVSGAAVGALSGLAIGSLTGSAGKGAAIGAVVGGVGGAVIGDQNKRKSEQAAAQSTATPPPQPAPPPPSSVVIVTPQQPYATGSVLGRLVGQWNITGTIDTGAGATLPVSGTARGSIDKTYFVRLDISFTDPRNGLPVQGTSVISQTGGYGVQMTNSFSSSPTVNQFKGDMDSSGTVFTLTQFDPSMHSRKVIIRLGQGTQWTADVWDGSARKESYTFTWVGQ